MMRDEPREEDQSMDIVLRSRITTDDDKGKQPEEDGWVRKAPEKELGFDLNHVKEIFMEAKKSFTEASTLGSQDKMQDTNVLAEVDPFVLTTFLETCMKPLHDSKGVKGLQELTKKCASKENDLDGHCVVRKIGKHKARTVCEIRLNMQIGDYEMDKVIFDLESDVNICTAVVFDLAQNREPTEDHPYGTTIWSNY